MRKGQVGVDWILGIAIFVTFAAFGLVYYVNFLPERAELLQDATGLIADRVMDSILVDMYEVPLTYDSVAPEAGAALYLDFTWTSGTKNSTVVLTDSTELPCAISGDRLYWLADLNAGTNTFKMRVSSQSVPLRCTDSFPLAGAHQVIPFSQEAERLVSQARIDQMVQTDYGEFKAGQGINRDFRITLNASGNITRYGATPLNATNIYVREKWKRIEETGGPVNIFIQVW
ncbi:MAG: hypothetical protein ACE5FW_01125 [Candidatus Aenigmatarchaeota archaeon]